MSFLFLHFTFVLNPNNNIADFFLNIKIPHDVLANCNKQYNCEGISWYSEFMEVSEYF